MAIRGQDIASVIKRQIEEFGGELTMVDVGTVVEAGDGVATIHGLSDVRSMELLHAELVTTLLMNSGKAHRHPMVFQGSLPAGYF